jgi:hypothetical protein
MLTGKQRILRCRVYSIKGLVIETDQTLGPPRVSYLEDQKKKKKKKGVNSEGPLENLQKQTI